MIERAAKRADSSSLCVISNANHFTVVLDKVS